MPKVHLGFIKERTSVEEKGNEEKVTLRGIVNTLSSRLSQLNNVVNPQEPKNIRRNIYYYNQGLR